MCIRDRSYMFQAGYYNGNTMLKLISFGGKAKTYLTYNCVTKEDMKRYGRRYHDSGQYVTSDGPFVLADGTHVDYYDDQTDNYLQINNQLILNHRFNDRWALNATAFYTYGYGYYKQYKDDAELAEYVNLDTEIILSEILGHLVIRVKRVGMILHSRLVNQVILPRLVQLRVIIRGSGNTRSDKMSLVLHTQINKRGITQRIVIRDIRRSRTFPQ